MRAFGECPLRRAVCFQTSSSTPEAYSLWNRIFIDIQSLRRLHERFHCWCFCLIAQNVLVCALVVLAFVGEKMVVICRLSESSKNGRMDMQRDRTTSIAFNRGGIN